MRHRSLEDNYQGRAATQWRLREIEGRKGWGRFLAGYINILCISQIFCIYTILLSEPQFMVWNMKKEGKHLQLTAEAGRAANASSDLQTDSSSHFSETLTATASLNTDVILRCPEWNNFTMKSFRSNATKERSLSGPWKQRSVREKKHSLIQMIIKWLDPRPPATVRSWLGISLPGAKQWKTCLLFFPPSCHPSSVQAQLLVSFHPVQVKFDAHLKWLGA